MRTRANENTRHELTLARVDRREMIRQLLGVAWVAGASARLLGNTPSEISTHDFTVPTVDQAGTKRFFPGAARRICDDLGAGISLQIALVPGGSFEMGSQTLADLFYPKEQPIHTVSIKPFGMGVFPVTRAHWEIGRAHV